MTITIYAILAVCVTIVALKLIDKMPTKQRECHCKNEKEVSQNGRS